MILIGINAALFLTEEIFRMFFDSSLFPIMALSLEGVGEGGWWQFLTHAFLHGNLFHLIVNMVALWFAGPILEELLGSGRYLVLYLVAALAGGILQTYSSSQSIDLVGASGAVCGLLTGFATLLPRLEITALIFFIIPVRMKAATLGWLVVIVSALFWFLRVEPGIGHLAHLGGALAGCAICLAYRKLGLVRSLTEMPPPIPPGP
jgi:membrane associated rhomboid family serine protease